MRFWKIKSPSPELDTFQREDGLRVLIGVSETLDDRKVMHVSVSWPDRRPTEREGLQLLEELVNQAVSVSFGQPTENWRVLHMFVRRVSPALDG